MQKKDFKINKGYTIIETMIAISLFLVVVFSGLSALLNVNFIHHKASDMRSIMDNLSFILEDISRNVRTGYNYRCYPTGTWSVSDVQDPVLNTPQSCDVGGVLVFEEVHGTPGDGETLDQWIYKIESPDGTHYNIYKSADGGFSFVQLNTDEISLTPGSGFSVLGAEAPVGDEQQPLVTIRLIGEVTYKESITPFALQTSVSQRLIDI